jgi:hypothetical protein
MHTPYLPHPRVRNHAKIVACSDSSPFYACITSNSCGGVAQYQSVSSWKGQKQDSSLLCIVSCKPNTTHSNAFTTVFTLQRLLDASRVHVYPSSPTVCTEGNAWIKLSKQENHFKETQNSHCFQSFTFLIPPGQLDRTQVWLSHTPVILPRLLKKGKL